MQEEKIFHAKNIGKSELVKKKTSQNAGFQVKKFIFNINSGRNPAKWYQK